ncbi:MAG: uroporphyrinogen-III synthase [Candidatus Symbiobacter sp.]|nr:uroporphyrinogen-III synthase [Candidatus Symbiobacter sp.]
MRILITRPREDAESLATSLQAMGHEAVIVPLMTIQTIAHWELDAPTNCQIQSCQAVMLSSANAARVMRDSIKSWSDGQRHWLRGLPIFCVGDATAEILSPVLSPNLSPNLSPWGFRRIYSAKGHGGDLAQLVQNNLHPKDGWIQYLCGRVTTPALREALVAAGFDLRALPLYDAVAATAYPPSLEQFLAAAEADGGSECFATAMFSSRSVTLFENLVRQAGREAALRRVVLFSLSPAVAAAARCDYAAQYCAARPNQAALVAEIAATALAR